MMPNPIAGFFFAPSAPNATPSATPPAADFTAIMDRQLTRRDDAPRQGERFAQDGRRAATPASSVPPPRASVAAPVASIGRSSVAFVPSAAAVAEQTVSDDEETEFLAHAWDVPLASEPAADGAPAALGAKTDAQRAPRLPVNPMPKGNATPSDEASAELEQALEDLAQTAEDLAETDGERPPATHKGTHKETRRAFRWSDGVTQALRGHEGKTARLKTPTPRHTDVALETERHASAAADEPTAEAEVAREPKAAPAPRTAPATGPLGVSLRQEADPDAALLPIEPAAARDRSSAEPVSDAPDIPPVAGEARFKGMREPVSYGTAAATPAVFSPSADGELVLVPRHAGAPASGAMTGSPPAHAATEPVKTRPGMERQGAQATPIRMPFSVASPETAGGETSPTRSATVPAREERAAPPAEHPVFAIGRETPPMAEPVRQERPSGARTDSWKAAERATTDAQPATTSETNGYRAAGGERGLFESAPLTPPLAAPTPAAGRTASAPPVIDTSAEGIQADVAMDATRPPVAAGAPARATPEFFAGAPAATVAESAATMAVIEPAARLVSAQDAERTVPHGGVKKIDIKRVATQNAGEIKADDRLPEARDAARETRGMEDAWLREVKEASRAGEGTRDSAIRAADGRTQGGLAAAATVEVPAFESSPVLGAAERAGGASQPTHVERLQTLIDRFDEHVVELIAGQEKTLTIRLVPDNLGMVELSCREAEGALRVELVVENSAVQKLIQQHEHALRQLLQQAGYHVGRFDVRTQHESWDSHGFGRGQTPAGRGARKVMAAAPETPPAAEPVGYRGSGRRGEVWYVA